MIDLTMGDVFKPVFDLIKDRSQVYIYGGMYIYLRKFLMEQGDRDNLYLTLDFYYLSSKLKKTGKGACTMSYKRFVEALEDGTVKPYSPDIKPLPTRIAGRKFAVVLNGDVATAIVITAKGKIYAIEGGRKGWRIQPAECNRWIEDRCFINTSSKGTGISYTNAQGRGGDAYHYGRKLREVSEEEANGLVVETMV
jgi:hypothetical protein